METLETLRAKIKTAEELLSVVKTMKALAAVSIRQYERAVASLSEYSRSIELGLRIVLRKGPRELSALRQEKDVMPVGIIWGSDQGMCGQFNDRIAAFAVKRMNELKPGPGEWELVGVGARIVARMEEHGYAVKDVFPLPSSVGGITRAGQEILLKIDEFRSRRKVDTIFAFYNERLSGSTYRPCAVQLSPISLQWLMNLKEQEWPTRMLPTFTMDWERLFSALVRQYFFISLYRAFAESLASENASRLTSMQNAQKNIEERMEGLWSGFQHLRQTSITEELFDIVSGVEALTIKRR